jgi:sugar/nucleoside kinase (ribokinase family)
MSKVVRTTAAEQLRASTHVPRALVGFDGFIDTMADVVEQRFSSRPDHYRAIPTIAKLAERIASVAGVSTNLEVRTRSVAAGGNGPYMAGAMARLGCVVRCIGALGEPQIDPVYADLASRCERVWSIAHAARTDALEFSDGKIMLNHPDAIDDVSWDRVIKRVGLQTLIETCQHSDVIATVNWTNLGGLPSIWKGLREQVFPRLSSSPVLFVDLADPGRRTDDDVSGLLDDLQNLQKAATVTLGLNLVECERLSRIAGLPALKGSVSRPGEAEDFAQAAATLRESLGLSRVIVHNRVGCGAADADQLAWLLSRLIDRPVITTGAGDHFNGGFAMALARGLDLGSSLAVANATATIYVEEGSGPNANAVLRELMTV